MPSTKVTIRLTVTLLEVVSGSSQQLRRHISLLDNTLTSFQSLMRGITFLECPQVLKLYKNTLGTIEILQLVLSP